MNTMFRKLTHLLTPTPAEREPDHAHAEKDNLAETEADSFLYGDGMGWTGIAIAGDDDEEGADAHLPPQALQQ